MTPHPNRTPDKNNDVGNGNGGSTGGAPSPSTPFHSRSATRPRNANNANNANNNNATTTYFQPAVHQFSCRGAFHLQYKKNDDGTNSKDQNIEQKDGEDLETMLKDTFLCNGIQTKLRHVADYPLAKSKEDAIQWFEGSSPVVLGSSGNTNEVFANNNAATANNTNDGNGNAHNNVNNKKEDDDALADSVVDMEPESSFSSYGTTQVNILTVQEVPVIEQQQNNNANNRSIFEDNDPFGGFGTVASSGMLNPFGSLFGGFFGNGGMANDPWNDQHHPGEDENSRPNARTNRGSNSWLKGSSRSVSSSTRMDRDENGKRVVTTITKTTVVDEEGKRSTEVVTTERHVDDGGRVETQKVLHTDDNDGKNDTTSKGTTTVADTKGKEGDGIGNRANTPHNHPMFPPHQSPFFESPVASAVAVTAGQPTSPVEVAVIATDNLLGVSISDSASTDPDSNVPHPPKKSKNNKNKHKRNNNDDTDNQSGWRKTEYLFRLGRFIPPFMIVNKYYQDKEEEERRRKEIKKEFENMRKKRLWDTKSKNGDGDAAAKNDGEKDLGKLANNNDTPISDNLSAVSSRTEYYLQRIYVQMGKNANMMGVLLNEMIQPDFPKKVELGGRKILDNMGPTAERTGKLMGDVWEMWMGWGGWSNIGGGDGNDDGDGGRGGRKR